MFSRDQIRYGNMWIRILCCFAVGCGCWNLLGREPFDSFDALIVSFFQDNGIAWRGHLGTLSSALIVFVLCVVPAIPHVERPLLMILGSIVTMLAYMVLYMMGLVFFGTAAPLTVPLAGVVCSTALLETMAWSEERSRRRVLEDINFARQQMTDMLVHDLKRRVSSIQMSLSLLRKTSTSSEKTADLMTTLNTSVDRMLIQMNALLDARKIQEGKMKLSLRNIAISEMVNEILSEYRPACELVNVSVDIHPDLSALPAAYVDPEVFSRVVANLLWNALQHAPEGSTIRVVGETAGRNVCLSVTNDGPAIPSDAQGLLFQPFSSGRRGTGSTGAGYGTGLGLAFCRLALEVHNGSILLQSPAPGTDSGVRVLICVPVAD